MRKTLSIRVHWSYRHSDGEYGISYLTQLLNPYVFGTKVLYKLWTEVSLVNDTRLIRKELDDLSSYVEINFPESFKRITPLLTFLYTYTRLPKDVRILRYLFVPKESCGAWIVLKNGKFLTYRWADHKAQKPVAITEFCSEQEAFNSIYANGDGLNWSFIVATRYESDYPY